MPKLYSFAFKYESDIFNFIYSKVGKFLIIIKTPLNWKKSE